MDKAVFNKLVKTFKNNCFGFTRLYEHFFPRIQVYIGRRYNDYHLGEDVAQEFFLKIFKINFQEDIENPTAWVFKVCDNIAKTLISKNNSTVHLSEEIVASIDLNNDYTSFKSGGLSEENIESLKKLDKETMQILVMHYWEGFNYKEIANKLGLRHDSVRRKASKALKKLRLFTTPCHTLILILSLLV